MRSLPNAVHSSLLKEGRAIFRSDHFLRVITEPSVLVAEFSTGVEEVRSPALYVFPNPSSGELNLEWIGGAAPSGTWQVMSSDGRLVLQCRLQSDRTIIPLTEIAQSHYIPRTLTTDGHSVRALIKSR